MAKNELEIVKEEAEGLLSRLGLTGEVRVEEDAEQEAIKVYIDTPQASILIGRHGETLSSFQLILSQIVYSSIQKDGSRRILVDSGDWRSRQEESLKNLALDTAAKVAESGEPHPLYNLRAEERRIVHMVLTDHPDVVTESEGEGRDRHITIKPRPVIRKARK